MKYFKIQTLQDNGGTPMDPVTILTAGAGVLSQLFPNIFNTRTKLTKDMVDRIFPGAGYWTVQLKQFLLEHTQWTVDMRFWYPFENQSGYIKDFVYVHRFEIDPGYTPGQFEKTFQIFQQLLKQEQLPGGGAGGLYPGYEAGISPMSIAVVAGLGILLVALSKKNKKRS